MKDYSLDQSSQNIQNEYKNYSKSVHANGKVNGQAYQKKKLKKNFNGAQLDNIGGLDDINDLVDSVNDNDVLDRRMDGD